MGKRSAHRCVCLDDGKCVRCRKAVGVVYVDDGAGGPKGMVQNRRAVKGSLEREKVSTVLCRRITNYERQAAAKQVFPVVCRNGLGHEQPVFRQFLMRGCTEGLWAPRGPNVRSGGSANETALGMDAEGGMWADAAHTDHCSNGCRKDGGASTHTLKRERWHLPEKWHRSIKMSVQLGAGGRPSRVGGDRWEGEVSRNSCRERLRWWRTAVRGPLSQGGGGRAAEKSNLGRRVRTPSTVKTKGNKWSGCQRAGGGALEEDSGMALQDGWWGYSSALDGRRGAVGDVAQRLARQFRFAGRQTAAAARVVDGDERNRTEGCVDGR